MKKILLIILASIALTGCKDTKPQLEASTESDKDVVKSKIVTEEELFDSVKKLISEGKLQEARDLVSKSPDYHLKNYEPVLIYIDSLNYANREDIENTNKQLEILPTNYNGPLKEDMKKFREAWVGMKDKIQKEQQENSKRNAEIEDKTVQAMANYIKKKQYDQSIHLSELYFAQQDWSSKIIALQRYAIALKAQANGEEKMMLFHISALAVHKDTYKGPLEKEIKAIVNAHKNEIKNLGTKLSNVTIPTSSDYNAKGQYKPVETMTQEEIRQELIEILEDSLKK